MRITVELRVDGRIETGAFTINDPLATANDVLRYAQEFCAETGCEFVGVV